MNDELVGHIRRIAAETKHIPPDAVQLDSTFEQLGMDSLDGLNIVFELEKTFGVSVPNDQVLEVRTIGDIVTTVERILREAGRSIA
jgi:acyl carrier protein